MKVIHNNKILRSGAPRLKVDEGEPPVECKIVIFFAPGGRLPQDRRDDEERERDGVGGVLL